MATIEQLKQQGHDLIEEYVELLGKNSNQYTRAPVYDEMQKYMKNKSPHFHSMREKKEIMVAIGTLKKMIIKKKIQLQHGTQVI